jgi:hypothetical protein
MGAASPKRVHLRVRRSDEDDRFHPRFEEHARCDSAIVGSPPPMTDNHSDVTCGVCLRLMRHDAEPVHWPVTREEWRRRYRRRDPAGFTAFNDSAARATCGAAPKPGEIPPKHAERPESVTCVACLRALTFRLRERRAERENWKDPQLVHWPPTPASLDNAALRTVLEGGARGLVLVKLNKEVKVGDLVEASDVVATACAETMDAVARQGARVEWADHLYVNCTGCLSWIVDDCIRRAAEAETVKRGTG